MSDHNIVAEVDPKELSTFPTTVIVGEEVGVHAGHLVVLGTQGEWRDPSEKDERSVASAAEKAGGFAIIAHPFGTRRVWKNWDLKHVRGVEIWNADAEWRNDSIMELVLAALFYSVDAPAALLSLLDRPTEGLQLWSQRMMAQPTAGFCAVDAHQAIPLWRDMTIPFPGYAAVFRTIRQHVWILKQSDDEREAILESLDAGRSYCAVDGRADGSGLEVHLEAGDERAVPGDHVTLIPEHTKLHVVLPPAGDKARTHVWTGDKVLTTQRGRTFSVPITSAGPIWLEVSLRDPRGRDSWTPWLIVNPIYVETPL